MESRINQVAGETADPGPMPTVPDRRVPSCPGVPPSPHVQNGGGTPKFSPGVFGATTAREREVTHPSRTAPEVVPLTYRPIALGRARIGVMPHPDETRLRNAIGEARRPRRAQRLADALGEGHRQPGAASRAAALGRAPLDVRQQSAERGKGK
jgi:hypothetical protein